MLKWWKVLAALLGVLFLGIGGYYAFWISRAREAEEVLRNNENVLQEEGATMGLPGELTTAYDPSVSSAIFGVNKYDGATGQAELVYKWPEMRAGQMILSRIACQGFISVLEPGETVPRLVSQKALLQLMSEAPADRLLLAGKCEDAECARIVEDCKLTVKAARRSDGE